MNRNPFLAADRPCGAVIFILACALCSAGSSPAIAQAARTADRAAAPESAALQPTDAHALVTRLAGLLADHYVRPEIGQRYANRLKQGLGAGEYSQPDARQLAAKLTEDLQAVARDGHLRVIPPGAVTPQRMVMGSGAGAIESARWIADGVAYLRLGVLPGSAEGVAALEKFLQDHADARTLIIDARATPGGSGAAADLMMSYFVGEPQAVLRMEMRNESLAAGWAPVREGPLVRRINAPAGFVGWERTIAPHPVESQLQDAQLFYLTSRRTGSAAEAMALALKRTF